VSNGGDGVYDDWFQNKGSAVVFERNGGWGIHSGNSKEAHGGKWEGHDGGANKFGPCFDESGDNYHYFNEQGYKLSKNSADTTGGRPQPNSLYNRPDGYPRWRDDLADRHRVIGDPITSQGSRGANTPAFTTQLAAGASSRIGAPMKLPSAVVKTLAVALTPTAKVAALDSLGSIISSGQLAIGADAATRELANFRNVGPLVGPDWDSLRRRRTTTGRRSRARSSSGTAPPTGTSTRSRQRTRPTSRRWGRRSTRARTSRRGRS
jgi:hypothetical protein